MCKELQAVLRMWVLQASNHALHMQNNGVQACLVIQTTCVGVRRHFIGFVVSHDKMLPCDAI